MIADMGVTHKKITVVTGGARGIGAAICTRLASEGHDVVIGYRSNAERARQVVDAVEHAGARALLVQGDTAEEADVERLFDAARELGPITGLVNNAGVASPAAKLVDTPASEFERIYAVNVVGLLLCAKRAVRDMLGRGGAIVNLSSGAATLGSPNEYVHYAGSKAAVDAITIGLAKELGPDGIRVNCVAPGTIWTEIHADPDRPNQVAPRVPLGRAGRPEEIAGAVAWLLSEDASYTTGAILRVSGGL
jgi:NAD(P)-dependent dehydrogenase (short-subunit alcohol dehydrogenase family)